MKIDETQATAVYALLEGIIDAARADACDVCEKLARASKDIMTGLAVENPRTPRKAKP